MNAKYIRLEDDDYYWVTENICCIANSLGIPERVVSILEGGYRIQGGALGAFARSIGEHVAVLSTCQKVCYPDRRSLSLSGTCETLSLGRSTLYGTEV